MRKQRLDKELLSRGFVHTRSQAESYIRLGQVTVNKKGITKPGHLVSSDDAIHLAANERYVSRAALKLASVVRSLGLEFKDKTVLDVGSSTGGFTDYAVQHRAKKVIAVDVGTDQLHPSLRSDKRIELHEKTDIRQFAQGPFSSRIDIVLVDVSFISLREILPDIARLMTKDSDLVAMAKPQFEAGDSSKHKGVIKNDAMRRKILQGFEAWVKGLFVIEAKADSEVQGAKGNRERFYLLHRLYKR